MEAALRRYQADGRWEPMAPTLEDVFIFLMRGTDNSTAAPGAKSP